MVHSLITSEFQLPNCRVLDMEGTKSGNKSWSL